MTLSTECGNQPGARSHRRVLGAADGTVRRVAHGSTLVEELGEPTRDAIAILSSGRVAPYHALLLGEKALRTRRERRWSRLVPRIANRHTSLACQRGGLLEHLEAHPRHVEALSTHMQLEAKGPEERP